MEVDHEGLLIDGAARDPSHIERLGIPVFALAIHPAPPITSGPGEINVPVCCGGVVVEPGDIVVADQEGIVVIPRLDLEAVLDAVEKVEAEEAGWLEAIGSGAGILDLADADRALAKLGLVTHEVSWTER